MGVEILVDGFAESDFERFEGRLTAGLRALRGLFARPGFGVGPPSLGAELELDLVDDAGRPAPVNRRVLEATIDPRVTLEIDRFNLELNTRPCLLAGAPFSYLAGELAEGLAATREAATRHGTHVVTIGILPTLTEADLDASALTDSHRYRALAAGVRRARGGEFPLSIVGEDELTTSAHDVTFEGANTSFQVHLRVDPEAYARTYNAAQIATAVALACACNSPLFLGRRLWQETRIALFRQAVDDRSDAQTWRPARVSFGHGWVRHGARELFEESVAMHAPLLPVCTDEDPESTLRAGGTPAVPELRLHHGTVWRWNRAVYDPTGGGHLRIEMRAFPSGPTVTDMVATAAFAVGLTLGLAPDADALVTRMTFGQARRNFYEAARLGLDAELLWSSDRAPSPRPVPASKLARDLLVVARRGLTAAGVEPTEADLWLAIVDARLERRATGARWQRHVYDALARTLSPREAAETMLTRYRELSDEGSPVHTWHTWLGRPQER